MRPEFPHDFDASHYRHSLYRHSQGERVFPCCMLRLGATCGNHALHILLNERASGAFAIIAVCEECWHELELSGEETTAYWRGKQREWSVPAIDPESPFGRVNAAYRAGAITERQWYELVAPVIGGLREVGPE